MKIDPYGVIFENYDATGRYQLTMKGKPIDSKSVLPDGNEVDACLYQHRISFRGFMLDASIIEHLLFFIA